MKRSALIIAVLIISVLFVSHSAFAQTPRVPKAAQAGEVEKRLKAEEPDIKEKKAPPVIVVEVPAEEMSVPEGKKIAVTGFEFEGNTVVDTESLQKAVSKHKNKDLSMAELQEAAKDVEKKYKKKGFFLARAYLPPQEVNNGVIKIAVLEGKLGKVTLERGKFYGTKFILKQFNPAKKGIINYSKLVRSLLILSDYPELKAEAILKKGSVPGTVDITIKVTDKFPFRADFDFDNFGSRYVSTYRYGFTGEYTSVLMEGDNIYYRQVVGSPVNSMLFEDVNYSIPLTNDGTRLGFEYTQGDFMVQREYKILKAKGTSKIGSLYMEHPVIKALAADMEWFGRFDYKSIKNFILDEPNGNDQLRVFKTGLRGDFTDNFRGRNFYEGSMSIGVDGLMNSSTTPNPEGSRPCAGSRYYIFNINAGRYQKFIGESFILLRGSAQMVSDSLPTAEQFSMGGADSVRGYPESDFLGDYGFTGTAEIRIPPPFIGSWKDPITKRPIKDYTQLLAFVDLGKTWTKQPQPGEKKDDFIVGTGFGVRINVKDGLDFRMDVGFPVGGSNPSDNSNVATYVQAIAKF